MISSSILVPLYQYYKLSHDIFQLFTALDMALQIALPVALAEPKPYCSPASIPSFSRKFVVLRKLPKP